MRTPILAVIALSAITVSAHADTYQISIVSGTDNIFFNVPSSPMNPQQTGTGGFLLDNLTFNYNGKSSTGDVAFYPLSSQFPGIEAQFGSYSQYFIATEDIQVFTGSITSPTFTLGSFTSTNTVGLASSSATVTITDVTVTPPPTPPTGVTPEPSSFALLCTGTLGVFGALRRRLA